jgi:DNA-directed RNA polymerase specialized sigma24 family protein
MKADDAVTRWIENLKAGDEAAARLLWERYFRRLVGLAAAKLARSGQRLAAEEDVALSAFKSLCLGAERGRFPDLKDRENLWPLLAVLTSRKGGLRWRDENRLKRGGGRVQNADGETDDIAEAIGAEPTPAEAAEMAETCERLLGLLDDEAREIALAKLEGYTNAEIATRQSLALRSVERKLQLIRRIWEANEA